MHILNDNDDWVEVMVNWINNWKKNGWKTSAKKPVKNKDLWQELDELVQDYSIKWLWVKGHSGHPGNRKS